MHGLGEKAFPFAGSDANELLPLFRTPRGTPAVASRGLECRFISGGGRPTPLLLRSSPSSEPDTGPSSRCALERGPGPTPLVLGTGGAAETSWGLTSPASPPGTLETLMPGQRTGTRRKGGAYPGCPRDLCSASSRETSDLNAGSASVLLALTLALPSWTHRTTASLCQVRLVSVGTPSKHLDRRMMRTSHLS